MAQAIGSNQGCLQRCLALIVLTTLWQLIDSSAHSPQSVNIELRRKRSLQWNGIELDESSLLEHLVEHEKALIFGSRFGKEAPEFKLVHVAQGEVIHSPEDEAVEQPRRQRRSLRAQDDVQQEMATTEGVETEAEAEAEVEARLQLQQSPQLIDDAFIFIRRTENGTQFVEHSPQLLKRLERCFYRSPAAALDLCEKGSVRGVFQQNDSDFVIHPLPARFGGGTHVLYQARVDKNNYSGASEPPR
nr:uncharacterized protein LOC122321077 [Drosophila bipectinata]